MSVITAPPRVAPRTTPFHSLWSQIFFHPADHAWSAILVLSILCGFLFFHGLTAGELYRTESLRAIIAAEYLRGGNWIIPTLYGEPIFTKPPGMYAAIALLSWPFGEVNEATARLPSAVAATITVFLIYWYFSRQLGRLGGLVAAAILPASFMWLDKATAAEIDMMQVAWVTGAIVCFLRALDEEGEKGRRGEGEKGRPGTEAREVRALRVMIGSHRVEQLQPLTPETRLEAPAALPFCPSALLPFSPSWFWWSAALVCVAGGVLTKWTAPAFFYGTAVPLLWWRGRLRLLLGRQHLVSVLLGAGICLAWLGTAVVLVGWHPVYDTVSREALMRLLPSHHHRPYPWRETLTHPLKIWVTTLPWSAFALLTLRPGFIHLWDERARRLLQALHCWTWPNLFFWSIIPEHAPRHSFPLFPGITGLAALVWFAWLSGRLRWPLQTWPSWLSVRRGGNCALGPARVLLAILACWLVVKLVFVYAVIPARLQNREPRAKGELLAALVPEHATLYLFRLKDEGIMFYYRREMRRLPSPVQLLSSGEPMYCILDESEWRQWPYLGTTEVVRWLRDEQGDPIVLVKVTGRHELADWQSATRLIP
jgi:4-amino-4-deoxy-L-arabinose transferase-like glycosyltransferase